MLHVIGLTKRYGRLTALSDVSFSINPGEVLGLIGPNGSGKTTLFECLGGVLAPDDGSLQRGDRRLTPDERVATLFYLPDNIAPWPAQTVRWALAFVAGYFGTSTGGYFGRTPTPESVSGVQSQSTEPESGAGVADVIRQFELEPLLESPIGTLSKGQRKRVLLAIGLLTPQPVLLADEPFDGLDLRQTREVAQTLRSYAASGRTIFLSIHQITDAARVCDRFVLLSGGQTRGEGTLDELAALAAHRNAAAGTNLEEIFLALT